MTDRWSLDISRKWKFLLENIIVTHIVFFNFRSGFEFSRVAISFLERDVKFKVKTGSKSFDCDRGKQVNYSDLVPSFLFSYLDGRHIFSFNGNNIENKIENMKMKLCEKYFSLDSSIILKIFFFKKLQRIRRLVHRIHIEIRLLLKIFAHRLWMFSFNFASDTGIPRS